MDLKQLIVATENEILASDVVYRQDIQQQAFQTSLYRRGLQ
jgi:hypothetical protein